MRVLLIEDDEAFRVGIEAFLLRLPAITTVRAVGDGEQGLEALGAASADVVILDIGLPGLGGLETCRRISDGHALPVLILTSQEDSGWVQRLWEAGASGYLHKAVGPDATGDGPGQPGTGSQLVGPFRHPGPAHTGGPCGGHPR
jgi:two-component system NarL family response regulator